MFADHRPCLSHRAETGCEVCDPLPKFIANRAELIHRLACRPGNRPVLGFLLRTDRATVEAPERDDAGCTLNQLGRGGSRRLRAELQPHLLQKRDDHGVDFGGSLDARALGSPAAGRNRIEQGLRQDASKRVLDADKEYDRHEKRPAVRASNNFPTLTASHRGNVYLAQGP